MTGENYISNLSAACGISHVLPLTQPADKVRPPHTALLVIDMQNDFCASDGFVARGGRDVSHAQQIARRLPDLLAGG